MSTITITLSERRPIKINPEDWPVIAEAKTFTGGNGLECQASTVSYIKVRQHEDGRRIVYGALQRGNGGMPLGWRGADGGFIVEASERGRHNPNEEETVRAIRRVAGIVGDDEESGSLAYECIAALPAEEI